MEPAVALHMFAVAAPGLEGILSSELAQIGLAGTQVEGGVNFDGSLAQLYEANLWLRTASRIVVRVDEFHASSFHELERRAKRIRWGDYLRAGSRVRFRVTCRKSHLYHSDAVAERFGKVIAQQVEAIAISPASTAESPGDGEEPYDGPSPAQLFTVRLAHDNCVVSVDSSGELLHRRGYRLAIGKAPLRETLAAAMVIGSGWDGKSTLIDPMCGSGVIAIEAALMGRRIPPGMRRAFAFQDWPGYDSTLWESLRSKARDSAVSAKIGVIMASDRDDGVVKSAQENAERAGVVDNIQLQVKPVSAVEPPASPGWIVTNPPYGVRVGDKRVLRNLYSQLGNTLRARAAGYTVALLSADPILESALKLRLGEVFRTRNGGIPVHLVKGTA
jgi:putative N6-adenine-specific DNA methylase